MTRWVKRQFGFTVVELLVVVVVLGIIISIVTLSYTTFQAKGRDTRRQSDIDLIIGYLELYASENNGLYPLSSGSTTINASWSTTSDASWSVLEAALAPYGKIPKDPISPQGVSGINSSNYAYYGGRTVTPYCGGKLKYLILYRLESSPNVPVGDDCPPTDLVYTTWNMTTLRKVGY